MKRFLRLLALSVVVLAAHAVDVYFAPSSISVTRAESSAATAITLTVNRTVIAGALAVDFTIDNTGIAAERQATVNDDYTISPAAAPTGTLSFADQQAAATITITLVNDTGIEGYQYIRVRLLDLADYDVVGAASTALVTIADDDLTASVINLFPVATEDPSLISPAYDSGAARRGVIQVLFNDESWFDKSVIATFAGTAGSSDYRLTYRIGGGGQGTALGWTVAAFPAGSTSITIAGDTDPLPGGTGITIRGVAYTVDTTYAGGIGTLTLTGPLTTAVVPGDVLTIPSIAAASGYVVTGAVGSTRLTLVSGFGGELRTGDVFYFGTQSTSMARYVVTDDPDGSDTFEFRRYTGGTTINAGLDVALSAPATVQVLFTASAPGSLPIMVPAESTQIQFGITPGDGTNANDGIVEGREVVTLGVALSNEYLVTPPTTGAVTIADIDAKASIALTRNAIHPETTGIATVTLTPPIPQQVTVPYSVIGGSATPGTDYTLSGTLTIPANTATGEIVITPTAGATIPVGGENVVLSLDSSDDYQRTTGPLTSSVATVTILPTTGTVTVSGTSGTEGGANGSFRIAIDRFPGHDEAVTVNYTVAGTAAAGTDYTTLSGSAVIPTSMSDNHVDIPVAITNDILVEGPETVILSLDAGSGYVLGGTTAATVTITDNEPTVTVTTTVASAVEGGATGSFTITMAPAPTADIAVPFTFSGDGDGDGFSATPVDDEVVFTVADPGPKVVTITATDNAVVDGDRILTLTLETPAAPATYSLGTTASADLTLVDNDEGVVGVGTVSSDGTYVLGDEVLLAVEFSVAVTVTGTPRLLLETGATDRAATYLSGSGSDTLVFRYTVQGGDHSNDLDYTGSGALTLAGGTITHGAGVAAVLTLPAPGTTGSLGDDGDLRIDGDGSAGKPRPGVVAGGSGGGCGLGAGVAALLGLCMLAGIALSVRRNRP